QAHDIPANGLATPEEALDDPAGRVVGRDGKDLIARFPVPMQALPAAERRSPALGAHNRRADAARTAEVEARS
ncbi:hypothetical protein ABTF55_20235, partial [Acinetobacter baumannii]